MLAFLLSVAIGSTTSELLPERAGTILGVVVNGSGGNQPLEGVEVVLRAGADGELVPVAETNTDRYGKFVFAQVPLEPTLVYLPGANRDGVHYPGQRLRLDTSDPIAHVTIVAFDAVAAPCPLVAEQHDVDVTIEAEALKVTERLLISNPTPTTYVGQSKNGRPPVTFWLSIPKNFDRVTFDKEFFGRRFVVIDHWPVTDVPWLPGEQELRFTYRVPLAESAGQFRRLLDVPTSKVQLRVHGASNRQVTCNLPRSGENVGPSVSAAAGEQLARGFTIEVQIASLPFPWMQYARWGSVLVLAALAGATAAIGRFRRRSESPSHVRRRQPASERHAA